MLSLEVGGVDGAHVGHDQHVGQRVFRLADGLNHAAGAYGSLNFSHDGIGNRTQLTPDNPDPEDIKTYNYQQWTHHLAGEAEHDRYTAHEYDWAGQLLGRATNVDDGNGGSITVDQKGFSYDVLGRLQFYLKNTATPYDPAVSGPTDEIDAPAPSSYRYSYNALDQRVVKERVANNNVYGNGQASRVYFYDLQGHLIAEMEPSTGVIVAETVWLGDQPITHYTRPTDVPLLEQGTIASPSNGLKPYSIHSDHLGTPQVLTDAQGTIAWQATYEPYGKTTSVTGNGANGLASIVFNLRLPGQYFDAESGLHQNWMRDYDPTLGRYIQSDPIGLNGGISTYAYVGGNPVSYTDPSGLLRFPDFVTFQLNYYVGSIAGTFSRSGNSFITIGAIRAYPNPVSVEASVSAGYLNVCDVDATPERVDNFLTGFAGGGAAAYAGVGGRPTILSR